MRIIRLVIFNEEYWNKGLIYTQNIIPLKKLAEATESKLEIISFTSYPKFISCKNKITDFCSEMMDNGITVRNMNVLYYPTRFMLPRKFMLPYFYMNVWRYVKALYKEDKDKDVVYNLRSYQAALAFYKYYPDHSKLIFDPRTDWIEENINRGDFKKGSRTVKFWNKAEEAFVNSFRKTILISDVFKEDLVQRYNIRDDSRLVILYNPIDYFHFNVNKVPHQGIVFLYTGSLGGWNLLENYLDFFKELYLVEPTCRLIVCTTTSQSKVESILAKDSYSGIKDSVSVYYDVKFEDLPTYYSQCDYGLQLMNKKDSRVGVKFVEYLAAGLIPIVNSNVQGAAFLSSKLRMGVVLDGNENGEQLYDKVISAQAIDRNSDSYNYIKRLTDVNAIADYLKTIYFD